MAKQTARKAEKSIDQSELFFDPKRDLNPFWSSSLFSDVYLKNDLPKDYKALWENDEHGGFFDFYQGFINLCHDLEHESFHSWREADTVKNWIVPVMNLLGWENNSERHQNSYIDNTSFTIEENGKKQVYRPDLIYFDFPQHKAYTQKEKDGASKIREARDKKTGAKIVLEAKYWDRLSSRSDKFKSKESDDSASGLGPELQTLKYMEIFSLDFGILTDGKTWKLYHHELSQGMDRRTFEFDLGNLRELAFDLKSETNDQKFRNYAKYFYYFFSKSSFVSDSNQKTTPFAYEVLEYSKKYAYSIEEDLKKRFIISMSFICNALKEASIENGTEVDLETIRNVAESHLFNILFTKSCEVRKILPIQSINYLKVSLHEIIEYLTEMRFDPEKNWDDFLRDFRFGEAFGGKKFSYEGYDIFNRFINLYEVIHDGTNKGKDFGFEIQGFKESIFSKDEWAFAKKHKIRNREMLNILFTLNFIESKSPDRKYQQIPYSYFTPRQLGSIYESFLEFKLDLAETDMIFHKGQWSEANLSSKRVKELKVADTNTVKKGELFFSPNNKERKITGTYYTPDDIVKYMIESTVGKITSKLSADELLRLKICDPAMGSGHFLSGALDYLVSTYRQKWSEEHNDDLEEGIADTSRKILDACIYGADINPRAVKLAKMSLWLVTASAGKKLERLDDQFKSGDSLLSIDWKKEFNQIFKNGGFDAVIGNPPYVRQEYLKEHKKHLETKFKVYDSNNDLYAYFIELGMNLVKPSGYFGMIVTNKWMRADFGEKLRSYLLKNGLETVLDFGDLDVFPGIAAYPVIVTASKRNEDKSTVQCLKVDSLKNKNYLSVFKQNAVDVTRSELAKDVWTDFNSTSKGILSKSWAKSNTLKQYINEESYSGIKTGLTKVYVIQNELRKELISKSKSSAEIIKPFAVGKDIKKYKQIATPNYLLFLPKGWTNSQMKGEKDAEKWFAKNYPAVFEYLKTHQKALKARSDQGDYWWELRACDYYDVFEGPKISYLMFQTSPCFTYDKGGIYTNNAVWSFRVNDLFLLGLLNSKMGWFFISNYCTQIQGGYQTAYSYMSKVPIPTQDNETKAQKSLRSEIVRLVTKIVSKNNEDCADVSSKVDELFYEYYNLNMAEIDYVSKLAEKMSSVEIDEEVDEAA